MSEPTTAPTTVILFGATGDLAKRKLIPGMLHLFQSGLLDDLRVVGTSLDDISPDAFRDLAHEAILEFSTRELDDADWAEFAQRIDYVPISAGPAALVRPAAPMPGEQHAEQADGDADAGGLHPDTGRRGQHPRRCARRRTPGGGPDQGWRDRAYARWAAA